MSWTARTAMWQSTTSRLPVHSPARATGKRLRARGLRGGCRCLAHFCRGTADLARPAHGSAPPSKVDDPVDDLASELSGGGSACAQARTSLTQSNGCPTSLAGAGRLRLGFVRASVNAPHCGKVAPCSAARRRPRVLRCVAARTTQWGIGCSSDARQAQSRLRKRPHR